MANRAPALRIQLQGVSPQDPEMCSLLAQAIAVLELAVHGARCDEWWAWADLGQFHLLAGHFDAARKAYAQGRQRAGPSSKEIQRHVETLMKLATPIEKTAPTVAAELQAVVVELVG